MTNIYKEKILLGTSPSLEMASKLIKDFYCGSEKIIKETSCKNFYDVIDVDGKILDAVFLWKKAGRFRFSTKQQ